MIGTLLKPVALALLKMVVALMSEAFVKEAIILFLEKLVAKTEADQQGIEHRLLAAAEQAWAAPAVELPKV